MTNDSVVQAQVNGGRIQVSVVGLDMPFGQMVWVMVKLSFAAAVATLITSVVWAVVAAVFVVVGGLMGTFAMTVLGVLLAALSSS